MFSRRGELQISASFCMWNKRSSTKGSTLTADPNTVIALSSCLCQEFGYRSLLLLILIWQLSFPAWPWPSPITTNFPGDGDWELPPLPALHPCWGQWDRLWLARPCPDSLGIPECALYPSWPLLHLEMRPRVFTYWHSCVWKKHV